MIIEKNVLRNLFLFAFSSLILSSCVKDESRISIESRLEHATVWQAGEPIAEARRTALSDWPLKGKITPDQIKKCFAISSDATMMQYFVFLSPFSENEKKLLKYMAFSEPPIISRTNVDRLKGVFIQHALLSPREAVRRGVITERAVTPGSEDILLGAFDCVFASVGPWKGSSRYGNVIIKLKDSVRERGWATPWSGFSFLHWIRKKSTEQLNNTPDIINDDDRLLYLMFLIDGSDWNLALGYEAIIFLRAQEQINQEQKDEIITKALNMDSPEKFWTFFLGKHYGKGPMGYLEAKFPAFVPSEYFESIEVPADRYEEIMSWPESEPYRKIIKIKDDE